MTATAGHLQLIVDSTSVAAGERALDNIARTGARVEGSLKIDMSSIEKAMARLGQQVTSLDKTMTSGMGRMSAAGQAQARTFEQLRASIDPAYAASMRFKDVQQQLSGMVERGEASQRAANIVLEQASSRYLGVATAAERAADAERKAAQETAMASQGYEQLRASVDPLYASSKRYESALETLDAAQKAGIISDRDRAQTLKLLEARMVSSDGAVAKASGGIGHFGMVANQVGYQIQDVLVSGPMVGWLRAVAQQAPQAAGAFSMLGGSIGSLVPWIGTAIALGAAFVPMLFSAGDAAKRAEKMVDDFNGALDDYNRLVEVSRASTRDLRGEFGDFSAEMKALSGYLTEVAVSRAMDTFKVETLAATNAVRDAADAARVWLDVQEETGKAALAMEDQREIIEGFARDAKDAADELGLLPEQAVALDEALNALGASKDLLGIRDNAKSALDVIQQFYPESSKLPPELKSAVMQLEQIIGASARAVSNASALTAEANATADAFLRAAGNVVSLQQSMASLSIPFKDAMEDLDFEISTAGMNAADKLVATRVRRLEETMRSASESAFGFDYGLTAEQQAQLKEYEASLRGQASALVKASNAGGKHAKQIERELDAIRASLSPLAAYNQKLADLEKLRGALSDDEFAKAIRNLNVELADSLPLVGDLTDAVTEGLFNGFDGTLGSITSIFKSWLIEMIAMAAKNQIIIGMGLSATGAAGSVAMSAATGGGGMLGGLLGNVGGSVLGGGMLGGISTGLGGILSGGGLGASFANLGGLLSGSVGGLGAIGAAIPAIGLLAVGIGALIGKTKELDRGVRVTIDGFDALVEAFRETRTSRLFGLIKRDRTSYAGVSDEISDPILAAVAEIQDGVLSMSDIIGIGAGAFSDFTTSISISTKDLSDEEIAAAIQEQLTQISDEMADLALASYDVIQNGETASAALQRLSSSLTSVLGVADTLGHSFDQTGVAGASLASSLVDAFGGLDAMNSATTAYYQAFYSETERQETALRQMTEALADLNITMPRSRDAYRALIEAQDLSTERGQEVYAALISMASGMDAVLPAVSALTDELEALYGTTQTGLEAYVSAAQSAAKASAGAAADWYKASDSIRAYIDKMRGSSTSLTSPMQARAFNEMQFQTTLAAALAGDLGAAGNLTSVAENLRQSVNDTARSRVEAALAEARILSDLNLASGVGDIEGARHDVIAGLLTDQADLAQETIDYLSAGNALTDDMIETLQSRLGSLDEAIKSAELINYAYLKERLAVTVDVLADADVPVYLRTLLGNAANGVTGYIDFLVRSDLTPDLKWLALTGASEHVATIQYLADNQLGIDLTKLAVDTVSSLEKTVHLVVGQELPSDVMQVALAGNSELSRIVNATLAADIGLDAKKLALTDVSGHMVLIRGQIADGNTDGMTRLLQSLGGATDGRIMLGGSFVFDPSQSFETLLGDSIETPMADFADAAGTLTGALGDLRAAIAAETARADKEAKISALNSYVAGLETDANGNPYIDDAILSQMSSITGVDISGMKTGVAAQALAGYSDTDTFSSYTLDNTGIKRLRAARVAAIASLKDIVADVIEFDAETGGYLTKGGKSTYPLVTGGRLDWSVGAPDAVTGASSSDFAIWKSSWWADGGLEDQLWSADRAVRDLDKQIASFATGGSHTGGLRLVGENGPELEVTGPSRIYNAGQTQRMLGAANDELIAEVRALRSEVKELREQSRRYDFEQVKATKEIASLAQKADIKGIKIAE